MTEIFQPLEIFFDGSELFLVVKEGQHEQQSFLTTYSIDIKRLSSHKVVSTHFKKPFLSSLRSRSYLILSAEDELLYALSPKTLETKLEWKGKNVAWGTNDDYVLNERNEVVNLHSAEYDWQKVQASSICKTQRAKQSGGITKPQEYTVPFVIECGLQLKIANDDLVIYEAMS